MGNYSVKSRQTPMAYTNLHKQNAGGIIFGTGIVLAKEENATIYGAV